MIPSVDIDDRIDRLEANLTDWNMVPETIAYITMVLAEKSEPEVLEVGTYNGYSALYWAKWADHVVTIERDAEFAQEAAKNFEGTAIELIVGDALEVLKTIRGRFDVVIIDAQKSQYKEYVRLCLPLLKPDGIILADNTISHKDKLVDFFDFLDENNLEWDEIGVGQGLVKIYPGPDA